MANIKPVLKRVCAYTVDLFIVLLLSSLISSIPVFNKDMNSYQKTYDKYTEDYNDYVDYITLLEESYEDDEINQEEYTKLTESTIYGQIITSKYDKDNKISQSEYKEIIKEINNEFDNIAKDYVYLLSKKGVSNSIITLICTLLYFAILQYLFKGQTIGKKLFKLKVVSNSDKKLNILTYILRSLVVNDVLLNAIGIIFLLTASKTIYQHAENIISTIISLVEAIIIFLVLTREDKRGLHDLMFNTKVISTEITEDKTKEDEAKIEEQSPIKVDTLKKKLNAKANNKKKIIDAEYKEKTNKKSDMN